MCNCDTPKFNKNKARLQPIYMRKSIHNTHKLHVEQKDPPVVNEDLLLRRGGLFITETQEPKSTQRKMEQIKNQNSEKTFRIIEVPKILNANKATFINNSSMEDFKSFRLVNCRQKLKELTDIRLKSLMDKMQK